MATVLGAKALPLMKARLNRTTGDTSLDTSMFAPLIEAAELNLKRKGITLLDDADDLQLLVDYATWRYKNRDVPGDTPQWLRAEIRTRFISTKGRDPA